MSQAPNVGTTLTGGVQDIAALLPLLGTDQCEKHVGSALEGGYLYAAATPLAVSVLSKSAYLSSFPAFLSPSLRFLSSSLHIPNFLAVVG